VNGVFNSFGPSGPRRVHLPLSPHARERCDLCGRWRLAARVFKRGLKRADAGGQPDAGPNTHNPMGLGYGGYLTRPYGYRDGQQPSQLIHNWAPARELH
jgi:hypothetical protein